ncbi:ABC transporter permease [Fredinandcohnia sp. FSL W7-1320]|uniref:ABC transporter permease n=1 Tax=Fredinandcohnia sp. FSL W7-1320 TaxID=2954540 RepID=UPI0030FD5090
MKSMLTVVKEHIQNFYLIIRLSFFEVKSSNNDNYLGILWEILNPTIQILIYWFVFGFGIRGGQNVGNIPFLPWLLSGIVVWFFINQALLQGSRSIYSRINIISKLNFPISVTPTFVIVSKFYHHIILVLIIILILFSYNFPVTLYIVQLPYFSIATFAVLISISLITSTLATIVRDIQMIVQSIVRFLLYLSPILWTVDKLPKSIQLLMKVNPFYYIVEGYRSALLGQGWYVVENLTYTIYFWCLVFVLFFIGSILHVKFRKHFVDYL